MEYGIYEKVLDVSTNEEVRKEKFKEIRNIDGSEVAKVLSIAYEKVIRQALSEKNNDGDRLKFIERLNDSIGIEKFKLDSNKFVELLCIHDDKEKFKEISNLRPRTSISSSTLFTGSTGPSLESELKREIRTADRIDFLVSFIKFSGLRLIYDDLVEFTKKNKLRVITTSYMGHQTIRLFCNYLNYLIQK